MGIGPERLVVVLAVASLGLALGCVGSEPRQEHEEEQTGVERPASDWVRVGRDTVTPATYQIFESQVTSESPRRATYRLVVMGRAEPDALGKAVRVALDSIGKADTTLAAARAILYQVRRVEARRGELVPTVWGEWVPVEGWDGAGTRSPRRTYRTYIYHGDPGWKVAATETREETGGKDDD